MDAILYPYLRRWENDIEAREKRFENDSNPVNFQILSILVQYFRVLGLVQDASHLRTFKCIWLLLTHLEVASGDWPFVFLFNSNLALALEIFVA